MGTVWPSVTLISFNTPAEGEGISASTLSVEISKRGSSRSILSPGFLSHLVMVPSKMLSPIWGMMTSTAIDNLLGYENLNSGEAFLVPDAGYAFQGVNLVTSMEKGDIGDFSHVAAVLELFGLEFIVVLASLEKTFQKRT